MTDYKKLVKALRETAAFEYTGKLLSKRECALENLSFDAADAIEALQDTVQAQDKALKECASQLAKMGPKRGEWNNHEVACLLAEMFGDDCACNLNGIDEWLPQYCEFAETCCPNPVGVACWEQFLKHRAKMEVQE